MRSSPWHCRSLVPSFTTAGLDLSQSRLKCVRCPCCSGRRLKQGSSGPPAKRQRTGTPRALGKSGSKSSSSADELSTASLRIPSVTGGAWAHNIGGMSFTASIV